MVMNCGYHSSSDPTDHFSDPYTESASRAPTMPARKCSSSNCIGKERLLSLDDADVYPPKKSWKNFDSKTNYRLGTSTARYLHQGSLRPKLVVLKPERTFCSHPYGSTLSEKKLPYVVGDIGNMDRNLNTMLSQPRCSPRWCVATFVAVVFVALGLALGIYFGFKLVEVATKDDKMFRGSFHVTKGDKYEEELTDISSLAFKKKAAFYQNKLQETFGNSILKNAFLRAEILAIDPFSNHALTRSKHGIVVHFNLHVNPRKVHLDAGDLYLVLANEIQQPNSKIFKDIQIDPASLEIEERRREYSIFASGTIPKLPSLTTPITISYTKTSTMTSSPTIESTHEFKPSETSLIPVTIHPSLTTLILSEENNVITSTPNGFTNRQCQPIAVSFCNKVFYNATTYPNILGHMSRYEVEDELHLYRHIVESDCYKYVYHFLCALLQPPCFNHRILAPCSQYCYEFKSKCHKWIPEYLLNRLECENFPKGGSSTFQHCLPEPDCSTLLNARDKSHWICDGIVDCDDFSDELKCEWCQLGQFRCGDKTCIDRHKRCDNSPDCPNAADELNCLSLSQHSKISSNLTPYETEGYLILQDRGDAAKVCIDTLNHTLVVGRRDVVLHNIGLTACELLNYQKLKFVRMEPELEEARFYFHIIDPLSARVTFMRAPCQSQHVVYVGCSAFACGRRVPLGPQQVNSLSLPGQIRTVYPSDWPWHVTLSKDGLHTCDGTLISDQWVLTSESCFQGQPKARWMARLGTSRLLTVSPDEQQRRVIGMIRSPVEGSTLALVHLSNPVNFSELVRPVCLANRDDLTPHGQNCVALGWDKTGQQLQERHVVLAESSECELVARFNPHNLCAMDTSDGESCQGEELPGSPLVCQEGNVWYVSGVLNWRVGCGIARRSHLYDKVSPNAPWILHTLENVHGSPPSGRKRRKSFIHSLDSEPFIADDSSIKRS